MSLTDEMFQQYKDDKDRQYKGHFNMYTKFHADCIKNGAANEEVPLLWIAYQIREMRHDNMRHRMNHGV